jgi:magnesium transporter
MPQSIADLVRLVRCKELDGINAWLQKHGALDIADELARLVPAQRAIVFRLLSKDRALAVFEALAPIHQQQLLDALGDESVHELFGSLDARDRARLLDEMPAKVASRMLARLPARARSNTNALLGYKEESVGRIMSPGYVTIRASMTAADALAKVRRAGMRSREVLVLPVIDDQRRLVGVVDLPDLVIAESFTRIADLVRTETFSVGVDEDQEVAARLMQEADLVALPVLDTEGRLVGVLTVDDAMEVIEVEDTEDIHRAAGGVEPLPIPYMDAGVMLLARTRAVWLLVLIAAAVLTVNVLQAFEDTLEQVVALALFIPLLIDTGGNSGAQAATVVIRAMALGEVRFGDLPRILRRELGVGVLLGLMLGAIALPVVTVFFGWEFGLIVSTTLVVICTWASLSGGMLPVIARRLGIDPAVVSAPVITTLVDATGLVIYFLIARAVLGI